MICNVRTLGISGIQGNVVSAECYISSGLPAFDIVGLPDASVKEARERVRAAAKSSGLKFPVSRITMNLAPALCTASATGLSPSGKRVESIVQLPFVFAHDLPLR